MVAGTSVVWLPVSDIDRSITFYRDQLGLNELQHEGEWAQLDANGLHLGLNARESPGRSRRGRDRVSARERARVGRPELRDGGVDIPGDISEHPWGRVATFKDPDGNDLQLYEPPA